MIPSTAVGTGFCISTDHTNLIAISKLPISKNFNKIFYSSSRNLLWPVLLRDQWRWWRRRKSFYCAAGRRWDWNAEGFRFREQKRRWWSDEFEDDENFGEFVADDEDDDDDEEPEQFWERIWIFKVFKAYGYLLPAIIASMLLATGPKAFLLALALPLGQSALSLAVEKIWGSARERPRKYARRTRKPFSRPSNFRKQKKDDRTRESNTRQGYKSWVPYDDGVANKRSESSRTPYGGWDEIESEERSFSGSSSMQPSNKYTRQEEIGITRKGKMSKMGRYREAPLLVRLLIAVFPFLGSWTRILW